MGLFSKNNKVPEIPSAPVLPQLPNSEKKSLPELPSFPANSINENFNQEMVKSAVADVPSHEEEEVHVDIPSGLHAAEAQKGESLIPQKSSGNSIPNLPSQHYVDEMPMRTFEMSLDTQSKPIQKSTEPIFVRIDKFQNAQKNFEGIKENVREIESVLSKIKGAKSKEEIELKGWSEDIEKIKLRLAEVDSDIFNQI